jgi:hypothetical protein
MHHALIDLTRELLSSGVFSHLPDNEVSRLHWIILGDQTRCTSTTLDLVLGYWYKGDYYSSNISPKLLQQCNELLQGLGRPLIEVYCEEFFES